MKFTLTAYFHAQTGERFGEAEVRNEQDAIEKACEEQAFFFSTVEQGIHTHNGEIKAFEENSGRCYVGIDRVYSAQEVLAHYEQRLADAGEIRNGFDRQVEQEWLARAIEEHRKKYGGRMDTHLLPDPSRPDDFIELKDSERVFDHKGRAIWPKATLKAKFCNASFETTGIVEIANELQALQTAIRQSAFYMIMGEVVPRDANGGVIFLPSSRRIYTGIDRVYTAGEVLELCKKELATVESSPLAERGKTETQLEKTISDVTLAARGSFTDEQFIVIPGKDRHFTTLSRGDKVFNKSGVKIWYHPLV